MKSDICLILEGTYPYISGGVSSWVYSFIKEFKELSFSIVFIGDKVPTTKIFKYNFPENIIDYREYFLFSYNIKENQNIYMSKKEIKPIEKFFQSIKQNKPENFETFIKNKDIKPHKIAYSYKSWQLLLKNYLYERTELSFIDYFWTWRYIYIPFLSLLNLDIPDAKVYHSPSTGYAGIIGAIAKIKNKRPFLITEHGIYTKERKMEITQSDWIPSNFKQEIKISKEKDFFREWWISFFSYLSKIAYHYADEIITIHRGNTDLQIQDGADPAKIRVIPNGIELPNITETVKPQKSFKIGFMGRVVSIKDVKTLIRACKIIEMTLSKKANIEMYIMGPTDEEPEYYKECSILIEQQSLQNIIKFTGKINVHEYYPKMDVIVLTSLSEGQPIVILEANAYGIPVVATDVGACRDLLYGADQKDQNIGRSGIITPVCSPEKTAEAIIEILTNKETYKQMSDSAKKRIKTYYQLKNVLGEYQSIYNRYMERIE
ncbi:GT4 family glycosyltransferase PelF, partial [bacterium]|nr:GT4 family glycosyltransferase PelF [bacterium]